MIRHLDATGDELVVGQYVCLSGVGPWARVGEITELLSGDMLEVLWGTPGRTLERSGDLVAVTE